MLRVIRFFSYSVMVILKETVMVYIWWSKKSEYVGKVYIHSCKPLFLFKLISVHI